MSIQLVANIEILSVVAGKESRVSKLSFISKDFWNMNQLPPLEAIFSVDGVKYSIKTSTIPNAGFGLFAQENIKSSQFLLYYFGVKLDHHSWKEMCSKNPRVKMYSIVEDPTIENLDDLFYIYGDVNMGNVAGYINSSISCKDSENVEYVFYPEVPPWNISKRSIVNHIEIGYIGICALKDINVGEELLCYYEF